jgi:hypothetical protein
MFFLNFIWYSELPLVQGRNPTLKLIVLDVRDYRNYDKVDQQMTTDRIQVKALSKSDSLPAKVAV